MAYAKTYTLDFGATGDNYSEAADKLEDNIDAIYTILNALGTNPLVYNLKPAVNAAVNKLDIFAKDTGVAPTSLNSISVMIPDGTGYTLRTRTTSYSSGTGQFIMADATNYWSKGSLDAEIKTAHIYAIWDGVGIVWALAGYSGFHMVPTSTTVGDDDYFLIEAGSSYTRSASHYCVCVGRIRYQYDTGDTPDHTIQATVENAPQVNWNPPSDYGYTKCLALSNVSGSDISAYSALSLVVKQAGHYLIHIQSIGVAAGGTGAFSIYLLTGSATYGSAVRKSTSAHQESEVAYGASTHCSAITYLNNGDTIHLGAALAGASANRIIYGDDQVDKATLITFIRID